jgi:hypothetical protein
MPRRHLLGAHLLALEGDALDALPDVGAADERGAEGEDHGRRRDRRKGGDQEVTVGECVDELIHQKSN